MHLISRLVLIINIVSIAQGYFSTFLKPRRLTVPFHAETTSGLDEGTRTSLNKKAMLLASIWMKICQQNDDGEVDFRLVDFNLNRNEVKGLIKHFQTCKDCAADNAFLMASQDNDNNDVLRLSNVYFPLLSENYDEEGDNIDDIVAELVDQGPMGDNRPIFPIEPDDEVILRDTKKWVKSGLSDMNYILYLFSKRQIQNIKYDKNFYRLRLEYDNNFLTFNVYIYLIVIADFGVCPFTMDSERAGIPMGGVRYVLI